MNATIRKTLLTRPRLKCTLLQLLSAVALSTSVTINLPLQAQAGDLTISPLGNQQINSATKNPVFFVTDRKEEIDGEQIHYVDGRSTKLSYGVSYPDANSGNQTKTVVFGSPDQFFSELAKYDKGEPICFLHGYHRNFRLQLTLALKPLEDLTDQSFCFRGRLETAT